MEPAGCRDPGTPLEGKGKRRERRIEEREGKSKVGGSKEGLDARRLGLVSATTFHLHILAFKHIVLPVPLRRVAHARGPFSIRILLQVHGEREGDKKSGETR